MQHVSDRIWLLIVGLGTVFLVAGVLWDLWAKKYSRVLKAWQIEEDKKTTRHEEPSWYAPIPEPKIFWAKFFTILSALALAIVLFWKFVA
jgi:hypothetical protein